MTPTALQIALWNGNLKQIQHALDQDKTSIEKRDARGNRALHLAVKFAHRHSLAIVRTLLDAGARVRSRDLDGWKTIHQAITTEKEDLLRLLIQKENEQAPFLLKRKCEAIAPALADVPDLYCEIDVNVATWIPGVSKWLPSDTVRIWKRQQDIRFDVTLVGYEHGAWKRGKLSFVLLGAERKFVCVDHEARTTTDLMAPVTPLSDAELDNMVHYLLTTSVITTDVDASEIQFDRKHHWFSSTETHADVGVWKHTNVYEMNGMVGSVRYRNPQNKQHLAPSASAAKGSDVNDALAALANIVVDSYSEVTIAPNADHVVSMELAKDETIQWKFACKKADIQFSVKFLADESTHDRWDDVVAMQRVEASDGEQAGSFCAPSAGTVVFKWDNRNSVFRKKKVRFLISLDRSQNSPNSSSSDDGWESPPRVREEMISFVDWFDVTMDEIPPALKELQPKHQIMVVAPPACYQMSKSVSATVYMSESFPLSVQQFLPVIEVLSRTTSAFENVKEFFNAELVDGFPVQFCIPLVPSVSATFRFSEMQLETPDDAIFELPADYTVVHEGRMVQQLTAV